jgi:hypothetical protein
MVRVRKWQAGPEQSGKLGDLSEAGGFFRRDEKVAEAELEARQKRISHCRSQGARSFEDIVQVRLGDADFRSEAAFGEFSRSDAAADLGQEKGLHLAPLHRLSIYLDEIGLVNNPTKHVVKAIQAAAIVRKHLPCNALVA